MQQKIATVFIIFLVFGLLAVVIVGSKKQLNQSQQVSTSPSWQTVQSKAQIASLRDQVTFFYGNTCPHCLEVEEWMKENNIEEKIKLIKLEVYDNKENSDLLGLVVEECRLLTKSVGVPFIYAQGKCYVGTDQAMGYLVDSLAKIEELEATSSGEQR